VRLTEAGLSLAEARSLEHIARSFSACATWPGSRAACCA
jgi:hypothetical protein